MDNPKIEFDSFYEDWQKNLGMKFKRDKNYLMDLLMPDRKLVKIYESIKELSLGKFASYIKDSGKDEINVEDLISLYSLEKKLNNGDGSKSLKTIEMKNLMEEYFDTQIELLGFGKTNEKLELTEPKSIGNKKNLERAYQNVTNFTNEFKKYTNYLKNKLQPVEKNLQSKIECYENKIKEYDMNLEEKQSHPFKRIEKKREDTEIDKKGAEIEKKEYELILQRINGSIEYMHNERKREIKNIIAHLEIDKMDRTRNKESQQIMYG